MSPDSTDNQHWATDDEPDPLFELDNDALLLDGADQEISGWSSSALDDTDLFRALIEEHEGTGFGPLWLAEVERICRRATTRYSPVVYNGTPHWDHASREDLLHDAVEYLLRKRQVEYICTVAGDLEAVRKLLSRQTKFAISARRRSLRTVVDNLVDRAVELLGSAPYRLDEEPPRGWVMDDARPARQEPSAAARSRLVSRLQRLPRLPAIVSERASPVWAHPELVAAVAEVVATYGKVDRGVLDEIFRDALTCLVARELVPLQEEFQHIDPSLGPQEINEVKDTVLDAVAALTQEERAVFAGKLRGETDSLLAEKLGVSRPTVDKYKRQAMAKVYQRVADIPDQADELVLQTLRDLLCEENP